MCNRKWQLSELTGACSCLYTFHSQTIHFMSHFSTHVHYINTSILSDMTKFYQQATSTCTVKHVLQTLTLQTHTELTVFRLSCTPVPHRVCVPQYLTEYGLAVYSRLPVLQSCQPVLLANSCGTAECTLVQVAVQPSVILSVVSVYRRPASDLNHFTFTTAMS